MTISASDQLIEWSGQLPLWAQDALRRGCKQETLGEDDIESLYQIALDSAGLLAEEQRATAATPLAPEHLNRSLDSQEVYRLKSITDLKNVNALATGQTLSFATDGLTVVYGHNGSGKSGYSRALKHACRARDVEEIRPDVTSDGSGQPSGMFQVAPASDALATKNVPWTTAHTPPELATLALFDGRSA